MRTVKYIVMFLFTAITIVSCSIINRSDPNKELPYINYLLNYINTCKAGGQTKAVYLKESKTIIYYTGKSLENYYQKFEIPLKKLDPNNIEIETGFMSGNRIIVKTKLKKEEIKAFEKGAFLDYSSGISYYLGSCMKDEKEILKFKQMYKKAILFSTK